MGNACSCAETPPPAPPLPGTTDVVFQGYLRILSVGKDLDAAKLPSSWTRRYFILRANGQLSYFVSGKGGNGVDAKGAVFLSEDFFVGDSLLHDHGFQISDLVATTWYMWADNGFLQLKWMTMLGTVLQMLGDQASKPAPPTDAPPSLWDVNAAESVEELVTRSFTMKQANTSKQDAKSIADLREQMQSWTSGVGEDSPWRSGGSQNGAGSIALTRISKRQGSGLFSRLSGAAGRAARTAAMHDDVLRPSQMVAERLERQALFALGENEPSSNAHLQTMPSMERVDEEAGDDDKTMEAIQKARISTMEHAAIHMEWEEAEAHAQRAAAEEAEAKAAEEAAHAAAEAADAAKAKAEEEARAQAAQAAEDAAAAEAAAEASRKAAEAEAAAAEAHVREKALHEAAVAKEAERLAALEEAAAKRKVDEAAEAEAQAALAAAEAKAAEEKAALEAREASEAAQRLLAEAEADAEAKKAALDKVASTDKAAAEAKAEAEAKVTALTQAEAAKADQVHLQVASAVDALGARSPQSAGRSAGLHAGVGAVKAVGKLTLLQQRAAELEERQRRANEEMKANPFSKNFDPNARKLKKGDTGYGKAVAGSETEARANKAQAWIEEEISKLIEVLKEFGVEDAPTKEVRMSFGELFMRYADISDTLVGILMRAKRRKRILFDSDMLFQGVHDHIVIRLMPA